MEPFRYPKPRRKVDGEWLCRWCGEPCPGRRSSWCSDECKHAASWMYLPKRDQVFMRDRGVCEVCKVDTEEILKDLVGHMKRCARPKGKETDEQWQERVIAISHLNAKICNLENLGFKKCFRKRTHDGQWLIARSLWEADHVRPRILGGEDDVDNLRTLCVPCHKAATKRLARFRATQRKKGADGREFR